MSIYYNHYEAYAKLKEKWEDMDDALYHAIADREALWGRIRDKDDDGVEQKRLSTLGAVDSLIKEAKTIREILTWFSR